MIFVANVLAVNGGTTFLIRMCRELASRGVPSAVLVLRRQFDKVLLAELERYSTILWLDDFSLERGIFFRAHLGIFAPIAWKRLNVALSGFPGQIHAMGVFGLLFALRLAAHHTSARVTVGIYHQNEFIFSTPPFYFASESKRLFSGLPDANIVFFNESIRNNYSAYFKVSYAASTLVPIGVDLSRDQSTDQRSTPRRIVSVGNLEKFKAYNAHMIGVVARLVDKYPSISYDIYGTGPEESALRALASRLGVDRHVHFRGGVPYADLLKTIESAELFVGSGTALIEAAAAGIPSMVGIESVSKPETYGFLSDVKGLSYNEDNLPMPRVAMQDLVERLFTDPDYRAATAQACREKAQMFSVTSTADGFLALDKTASEDVPRLAGVRLTRIMFSLLLMALADKLKLSTAFAARRNQSF